MKSFFVILMALTVVQVYCRTTLPNIIGGVTDTSVDRVTEYNDLIEKTFNQKTNDDNYHKIVKINSARSQVVAGIKYYVDYTVASTDCKKKDVLEGAKDIKSCKENQTHECTAVVIVRLWEKYVGVEGMKCKEVKFGEFE